MKLTKLDFMDLISNGISKQELIYVHIIISSIGCMYGLFSLTKCIVRWLLPKSTKNL